MENNAGKYTIYALTAKDDDVVMYVGATTAHNIVTRKIGHWTTRLRPQNKSPLAEWIKSIHE